MTATRHDQPRQHRRLTVPRLLHIGPGAIGRLPGLLARELELHDALVVGGPGPSAPFAQAARESLAAGGIRCNRYETSHGTIDSAASLAAYCISTQTPLVIAVGGGRVIDTAKYAAARTGIPIVAVPTTLSHDGISSPVASLLDARGTKQSLSAVMPAGVVVDSTVIAQSPRRTLRAGLGDLVSNLVALSDWRLAESLDQDRYDEFSALIAESAARPALDIDSLDAPGTIDILAKGLVMSGLAMATAGTSRPCSGAEHLISHALDHLAPDFSRLHGEQVALGSLIAAAAHGEYLPALQTLFRRTGLPTTPAQLGISDQQMREAVQLAPAMRPGRHTILTTLTLSNRTVDALLEKAFYGPATPRPRPQTRARIRSTTRDAALPSSR
jgi:glycerol-1-phosphate dehydrogenase [NAD(P)+]